MWDLSFATRDQTHAPHIARWILNPWTTLCHFQEQWWELSKMFRIYEIYPRIENLWFRFHSPSRKIYFVLILDWTTLDNKKLFINKGNFRVFIVSWLRVCISLWFCSYFLLLRLMWAFMWCLGSVMLLKQEHVLQKWPLKALSLLYSCNEGAFWC